MSGLNAAFLDRAQIEALGFAALGSNVLIHPLAVIVNPHNVSIGDNVRIDPFSVISASSTITIGSYVHISSHCTIMGRAPITIGDFCALSLGARILSSSEGGRLAKLVGAAVPPEYQKVVSAPVVLERYSAVSANSIVLPGVTLREGSAVGALSLVMNSLREWTVYIGVPARPHRERPRDALELGPQLLDPLAFEPHALEDLG